MSADVIPLDAHLARAVKATLADPRIERVLRFCAGEGREESLDETLTPALRLRLIEAEGASLSLTALGRRVWRALPDAERRA